MCATAWTCTSMCFMRRSSRRRRFARSAVLSLRETVEYSNSKSGRSFSTTERFLESHGCVSKWIRGRRLCSARQRPLKPIWCCECFFHVLVSPVSQQLVEHVAVPLPLHFGRVWRAVGQFSADPGCPPPSPGHPSPLPDLLYPDPASVDVGPQGLTVLTRTVFVCVLVELSSSVAQHTMNVCALHLSAI